MTDIDARGHAAPQDELLPFLNNFHDIFTTIGVAILFVGLGVGAAQLFEASGLSAEVPAGEALILALVAGIAVIAWALSAILVGRQRRILPGIALCVVFAACAGGVLAYLYARLAVGVTEFETLEARFEVLEQYSEPSRAAFAELVSQIPAALRFLPIALGLAFTLPVLLFYAVYRLPFAGGLLGVGIVATLFLGLMTVDPYTAFVFNPLISLLAGLALFLAGVAFDSRDPARNTRLSGTAFWLHFFAAPILLSAAVTIANIGVSYDLEELSSAGGPFMGFAAEGAAAKTAAVSLAVIIAFAFLSLLINRRALIVSGLVTAGVSIGILVNLLGLNVPTVFAVTLLLLGGVVVLLGAAWHPARRLLLGPFPQSGPVARVFPPETVLE